MPDQESAPAFAAAVRGMVKLYGGVRAAGRLLQMSPSTLSRLARGKAPDPKNASVVARAAGICPCCGQAWNGEPI